MRGLKLFFPTSELLSERYGRSAPVSGDERAVGRRRASAGHENPNIY
jgi:hypothetical protein